MTIGASLQANATDSQGLNLATEDDTSYLGELIGQLEGKTGAITVLPETGDVTTAVRDLFLASRSAHSEFMALQIDRSPNVHKHRDTLRTSFERAITAIQGAQTDRTYLEQLEEYKKLAA